MGIIRVSKPRSCEAHFLIVGSFSSFLAFSHVLGRLCMQAEFFISMQKAGEFIDFSKFTQRRVPGLPAQALPQENGQERYLQYHSQQTLVHLQERTAPHG